MISVFLGLVMFCVVVPIALLALCLIIRYFVEILLFIAFAIAMMCSLWAWNTPAPTGSTTEIAFWMIAWVMPIIALPTVIAAVLDAVKNS